MTLHKQTFTLPSPAAPGKRTAYVNARIIDPATGYDDKGGLLIEAGRIADLGPKISKGNPPADAEIIDCGGHVLAPGLIDIHVHLREPGGEHKETIATGSKSAAAGGVTTIACMPNTKPAIDDVSVLEFIFRRARETAFVNVCAWGAISKGLAGEILSEMGILREAGAIGFSDAVKPITNSYLMRHALAYVRELGVPLSAHAEDPTLSGLGVINEGPVSARLGLAGIPNAAEASIIERNLLLSELTGGHYHAPQVSTRQSVEAIRRAKTRGLRVTAEATPHHLALTDEAVGEYKTFCKMNPPLRAEEDRLAVIAGLADGTIDAIATGHAPHDQESKRVPMASASFGVVGLETMLPVALSLYHQKSMPLIKLLAAMTCNPAKILGLQAGTLKIGAPADLALIDLDRPWRVDPKQFVSKSHNSPFDEWPAKGRAIRTIVGGQTVYELAE